MKMFIALFSLVLSAVFAPVLKNSRWFPDRFFEPDTRVYDFILALTVFAIIYALLELAYFGWQYFQLKRIYGSLLRTKIVPTALEKIALHDQNLAAREDKHGKIILHLSPLRDAKTFQTSLISHIPPILTALGIFGTFLGISLGLQSMGSFRSLSSNKIIELIAPLLGGMATAFHTSLLGIGAGVVVIALDKLIREPAVKHGYRSLERFFSLHFILGQEAQSETTANERLTAEDVPNLLQSIREKLELFRQEETLPVLQSIREKLELFQQEETLPILQSIREKLELFRREETLPVLQSIREKLELFRQEETLPILQHLAKTTEQQQKDIVHATDILKKGFVAQIQRLDLIQEKQDHTDQAFSQAQQMLTLQTELQQGISRSIGVLVQTTTGIQEKTETLNHTLQQSNESIGRMEVAQQQAHAEIREAVQHSAAILTEQKHLVEQTGHQIRLLGDFQQESARQFTELKGIFGQFQREMGGFIQHLHENLQEHRTLFGEMTERSSSQIQRVGEIAIAQLERVGDQLGEVGRQSVELLQQANQSVQETLQGVGEELERTGERVTSELERFREAYTAALHTFFDRQQQLLEETLGRQRAGLAAIVEQLQDTLAQEMAFRQQSKIEQEELLGTLLEHENTFKQRHEEVLRRLERVLSGIPLLIQQSVDVIESNSQRQLEASSALQHAVEQLQRYSESLPKNLKEQLGEIVRRSQELQQQLLTAFENFRLEAQVWVEVFFSNITEKQNLFLSLHDKEASKIFDMFAKAVSLLTERTSDLSNAYTELYTIMNIKAESKLLSSEKTEQKR